jgi:hypothetical protein
MEGHPIHRVDALKVKPIFNHRPNPSREATMEKKMCLQFGDLITKGAFSTIRLPVELKPVHRPNAVLDD